MVCGQKTVFSSIPVCFHIAIYSISQGETNHNVRFFQYRAALRGISRCAKSPKIVLESNQEKVIFVALGCS